MEQSLDSGQAGAPNGEIEITPEMIEAGATELLSYDQDFDSPTKTVAHILAAVFGCEVVALHEVEDVSPNLDDFVRDFVKAVHGHWLVQDPKLSFCADALDTADKRVIYS